MSRVVQFTNWETLICMSWSRYPELFNANLAWSMYRRDWFSALVAFVFDLMRNKCREFKAQFEAMIVPCCFARVNFQWFLLNEICTDIHLLPLVGMTFEENLLEQGWEKAPNCDCLFVNREKGLFLSVSVDDIKLAERNKNMNQMWKRPMKNVDLREPTSFFDHVCLGCTQRECQWSKDNLGQLQRYVWIQDVTWR